MKKRLLWISALLLMLTVLSTAAFAMSETQYNIIFCLSSGEYYSSQQVMNGGKLTDPGTPAGGEVAFCGWYDGDGKKWDFENDTVTSQFTLTAVFHQPEIHAAAEAHPGQDGMKPYVFCPVCGQSFFDENCENPIGDDARLEEWKEIAGRSVYYLKWDETAKKLVPAVAKGNEYFGLVPDLGDAPLLISVTEDTREWETLYSGTFFVVDSDVTIDGSVTVAGRVRLILEDGCTLTVTEGIRVCDAFYGERYVGSSTLEIYAQSTGDNMGKLICLNSGSNRAPIGGVSYGGSPAGGTVIINGGRIEATSTHYNAAGIGGVDCYDGGTITINAGYVTAIGGENAPGIGGGGRTETDSSVVTINGGVVEAIGGENTKNPDIGEVPAIGGGICSYIEAGYSHDVMGQSSVTLAENMKVYESVDDEWQLNPYRNQHEVLILSPLTYYSFDAENHDLFQETLTEPVLRLSENEWTVKSAVWGKPNETTWIYVDEDFTVSDRITAKGDVCLILKNGTVFTAEKGISVCGEDAFLVFGQHPTFISSPEDAALLESDMPGKLIARGTAVDSGIGSSESDPTCGWIEICGGWIECTGKHGIGGENAAVTIQNGVVKAESIGEGAAIGGSCADWFFSIEISGGWVTAVANAENDPGLTGGAGVGVDPNSTTAAFAFTQSGGTLNAVGADGSAGIGDAAGATVEGSLILISGGANVFAFGGKDAVGIGFENEDATNIFFASDSVVLACGGDKSEGEGICPAFSGISLPESMELYLYSGTKGETSFRNADKLTEYNGEPFVLLHPLSFGTMSLSLGGTVGVNLYATSKSPLFAEKQKFAFTNPNTGETNVTSVGDALQPDGRYKFSMNVATPFLADTLTGAFLVGDYRITTTLSPMTYINSVLKKYGSETDNPTVDLVKALLSTGYYGQKVVASSSHPSIDLGGKELPDYFGNLPAGALDPFSLVVENKDEKVSSLSGSLLLDADTSIVLYVTTSSGETLPSPVRIFDGKGREVGNCRIENVNAETTRIVIPDIPAHRLGETFSVKIGEKMTVKLSALTYAQTILLSSDSHSSDENNLAASLYAYAAAAKAYRK